MDVYKSGTPVTVKIGRIEGHIKRCIIAGQHVSYDIGYFYEGIYREATLQEYEFDTTETKSKVGFK